MQTLLLAPKWANHILNCPWDGPENPQECQSCCAHTDVKEKEEKKPDNVVYLFSH